MCFDPTEVGAAFWLLVSSVLPDPPVVIDVSNFPKDRDAVASRIALVTRFKVCAGADYVASAADGRGRIHSVGSAVSLRCPPRHGRKRWTSGKPWFCLTRRRSLHPSTMSSTTGRYRPKRSHPRRPLLLAVYPATALLCSCARAAAHVNRFQTVTGKGGAVRYFANLAIGSLTRPCHVHPDFKVFVVYPWSQIVGSPPAFLDRFAKFMLSMREFLTKRHEAAIFSRDDKGVEHSIFSILRGGVDAFVEKMHRSSFFGLVTAETVPSLVLSLLGIRLTEQIAAADGFVQLRVPLMPSPFHPPKNVPGGGSGGLGGGGRAPVEWLDLPGSPTAHLAEYVRQANFHLLQLMRPESVYLHRTTLPPEYLREYIERQEHFSLARFVAGLVRTYLCEPAPPATDAAANEAAPRPANAVATGGAMLGPAAGAAGVGTGAREATGRPVPPPVPPRARAVRAAERRAAAAALQKWVVFTRSSGELKRLYTDWGLLAPLLAPLRAQSPAGLDTNAETFIRYWAAVYNLDRFETEAQCNDAVQAFAAHPTQRALLVLADMGAVQASQVNHVRFQVEEHVVPRVDDGRSRVVVVVVHVPPEQVMKLPAAYQAVFLRDWQFLWVDGLGAFAAPPQPPLPQQQSQQAGAAAAAGAPALPAVPSAVMELDDAMDARRWVAVAFGLEQAAPLAAGGEGSARDAGIAGGEMVALFEESLRRCIEQHISDPTELPMTPVYAPLRTLYGPRSAPAKVALLGALFGTGGALQGVRDELLHQFVQSWAGAALGDLVRSIATSLERAESACTFLDSIRRFLRFRMEAVLIRVLAPLLNYFGLATLRDALQGPAAPFHGELVQHIMRVLVPAAMGAALRGMAPSSTIPSR